MSPHIHDKIDFTAEVFIVYKNKVLLRIHDKYNIWLGVGGHIELDEDPIEAVVREAKEEVGLDIHLAGEVKKMNDGSIELIPPFFMNRHHITDRHEHVTMIYFASADTDKVVERDDEKSKGYKWFGLEELEANQDVSDKIKNYAIGAIKAIKS